MEADSDFPNLTDEWKSRKVGKDRVVFTTAHQGRQGCVYQGGLPGGSRGTGEGPKNLGTKVLGRGFSK